MFFNSKNPQFSTTYRLMYPVAQIVINMNNNSIIQTEKPLKMYTNYFINLIFRITLTNIYSEILKLVCSAYQYL